MATSSTLLLYLYTIKNIFRITQLGSNWNNGSNAGSFYWNLNNSVGNRNRNIRGVDFLGYRTFLNHTLLRKSTCLDMERKLTAIRKKVESGNMMNYSEWCCINSYRGWLKHCDSFRLQQKYVVPLLPYADEYYICNIKPEKKKEGKKAA